MKSMVVPSLRWTDKTGECGDFAKFLDGRKRQDVGDGRCVEPGRESGAKAGESAEERGDLLTAVGDGTNGGGCKADVG